MTEYFISILIVSVCYISHIIHSKLDTLNSTLELNFKVFKGPFVKQSFISSHTYLPAHRLGFVNMVMYMYSLFLWCITKLYYTLNVSV